ncbi:hypothetical protein [Pseudoxanthomonas sp. Root630]|uniref:hypothetical protein n=1 Tax=Pseudoxanthomonas sp. Root630 TaxID=1736574 RepID=UPI000A7CD265|nr:hypothetical protein [Pseudoxanthomonas sp. Root630]
MAAVTAAVAVGAGMAYSANRQGAAAKAAGRAQGNAASDAMAKYDDVYNQGRQDASGWLTTGQQANSRLQALMNGDFSSFQEDPSYQWQQDQGLQGLSRMAAARGNYRGGATDADILRFNQGLASQEYGKFFDRNMALSNQGLGTAQYLGQLGQNYAQNWAQARGIKGAADAQRAAAGPMTQAGYGNAIASAFSTYAGMGGGGGGGLSSFGNLGSGGSTLWGKQAATGPGSIYNFGNNQDNLWSTPRPGIVDWSKGGGW